MSDISEINKDTFWMLIDQGREQCGQDVHALAQWLEDRLMELGPEQALNFDYIAHAYRAAAYKYGLWNAASIMCDGCTDDGFTDFRGWLIAQGRDVYMAALKDPDSLADVPTNRDCCCETLCYVGSYAYEELTGRDINQDCMLDRNRFLIDHAAALLAVYNGEQRGGTAATMRYAQKMGREVIVIDPITRLITHDETAPSPAQS